MNKTGLKTFVCSFVFTLSAIVTVDRAFFYAPETAETVIIPRKNIALFFSGSHPKTFSSSIEPVHRIALQNSVAKPQEVEIAENIPEIPQNILVRDASLFDTEEIPLQLVAEQPIAETAVVAEDEKVPDVPLVYANVEKTSEPIVGASQEPVPVEKAKTAETPEKNREVKLASLPEEPKQPDLLTQPVVIKGTRQIIKIDNFKKKQQKQKTAPQEVIASNAKPEEQIPLLGGADVVQKQPEPETVPSQTQVASLGADMSLTQAEEVAKPAIEPEKRDWQTMAEKHQDENPWVVARGSKFVKNKKLLEEKFSSEAAQKKAELLTVPNKAPDKKSAKVAVQDNLLIPIPQELLDEDDLVPELGDGKNAPKPKPQPKPKAEKVKEESSFLDSITSVFSKESREKAINNLKKKSGKLLGSDDKNTRPQILPTEIRLSFQPNRAEISGQTLRWIQAFAKKAVDEADVGLEIRIDGSGAFALQQKRLNLLYNILTANGVDYQKINTVFVEREPNSFVVRTVKITNGTETKKEDERWKKYYQQW